MAVKLGTENKRNVVIAAILLSVVVYLGITQLLSGPPHPQTAATAPAATTPSARRTPKTDAASGEDTGEARKVPTMNLDPTLHLERLKASESIEYAGTGRNIFSMDSAPPVRIEKTLASARPDPRKAAVYTPPPAPRPPAIDLKFFGYSVAKDGARRAFLLHGEDIFDAGVGEIVDHRFKVISITPTGVQVTDLGYNNTETLPLESN